MSRTDLTFAEQRLLSYAAVSAAPAGRTAPQPPRTVAELAELLGLDKETCTRALHALAGRGLLRLRGHPDGRYELLPGRGP